MTDKKISELPELASAENDDLLVVVDTSENETKKIQKGNLSPVETDPVFTSWLATPPNISIFTNNSGYLISETDPTFSAWLATSPNLSVFTNDVGYLTIESDTLNSVATRGASSDTILYYSAHPTFSADTEIVDKKYVDDAVGCENLWDRSGSTLYPYFTGDAITDGIAILNSGSLTSVKLGSLTSNGFIKTSGSDGSLLIDTNSYITGNQTITLTGAVTGSGTTTIISTFKPNGLDDVFTGSDGLLKKTGVATYTLDTNSYLTTESDTLDSVTTRGATTNNPIGLGTASEAGKIIKTSVVANGGISWGIHQTLGVTQPGDFIRGLYGYQLADQTSSIATGVWFEGLASGETSQSKGFWFENDASGISSSAIGIDLRTGHGGIENNQTLKGLSLTAGDNPENALGVTLHQFELGGFVGSQTDPTAEHIGIYADMQELGTDANMKKWMLYNNSNTTSGKIFLGGDFVKSYLGSGFDASVYFDGTDMHIKTNEVAANGLKIDYLTSNGFVKTSGGTGLLSIDTSSYLITETDPLSLHLDQSTPQTFSAGAVTGSGLLNVTSGVLGLNTNSYITTESDTLAIVLARGADANDISITSLATLYFYDNNLKIDGSADGVLTLDADTTTNIGTSSTTTYIGKTGSIITCGESIVSDTANTDDLGSSSIGWRYLYLDDANTSAPSTNGQINYNSTNTRFEFYQNGNVRWLEGGWFGSSTRIKILPNQFEGTAQDKSSWLSSSGEYASDENSSIIATLSIPTGYKATNVMVYSNQNNAVNVYECVITDGTTATNKGSGNCNTEIDITDVTSSTTNYLSIVVSSTTDQTWGGYITIARA